MASIRNRGPHQWQARVFVKGARPVTKTFTTRRDAQIWARHTQAELERGTHLPCREAEATTIETLVKSFESDFGPYHYRSESWRFKLVPILAKLGHHSLASLTPRVVGEYRDIRLTEPDSRFKSDPSQAPRVSPVTVRSEINLLSKLIGYAQKEHGIVLPNGNPVLGVRKPSGGRSRERRLSPAERERLLEACAGHPNRWLLPAVLLALETAMRQGELLALRWEDIDLKRGVALLEMTKNGEARAVPLSSDAIEVIKNLPREPAGTLLPVLRGTLSKAYTRACQVAGLKDLTFHDLRHEAISTLAEITNFNILELAAISGHKDPRMLKRYTHLDAGKLADRINAAKTRQEQSA